MQVNQRIGSVGTKEKFVELLIVDINEQEGKVAVTDVSIDAPRRPTVLNIEYVEQKLKLKQWQLELHDFPESLYQPDKALVERFLAKQLSHVKSNAKGKSKSLRNPLEMRDEAWDALKPLLDDPEMLHRYLYGDPAGILAHLEALSGRSRKYITTNLNRYFYYGGMRNSLLPTYYFCGTNFQLQDTRKQLEDGSYDLSSKPGPATQNGNEYNFVTKSEVEQIKSFLKRNLANKQEVVLEKLYDSYIEKHCSVKIRPNGATDDDIIQDFHMALERRHLISPKAFKRQVKKLIPDIAFLRKKVGEKNYMRDHAAKPGVAKHGLRGATSRYEIDSTVLDVYVRYEFSNELLSVGRPILYVVIDVVTGMVVGMHVCFHGPDWCGASQALLNAFSDKVEFCRKFGLDIKPEDWPCHHVCRELTADRGTENSDDNMESILKGRVGIQIVNLNAFYMGCAKGTVEKKFDTTQDKTLTFEAGKVEKVPRREDRHASRRALFTYEELVKALIKTILFENNHVSRVNARTFEMERDGVAFTPRAAWKYSLRHSVITPATISEDRLMFGLLPEGKASVQGRGVYFNGLYYNSRAYERLGHLDEAKNFGRKPITIRYSDTSTNSIWWRDEDTKKLYKLDLTERSEAYKNLAWASVLHRLKLLKNELELEREQGFIHKVLLNADLRGMEKAAQRKVRKLKQSRAKSPAKGTKERQHMAGELQKHDYQVDLQVAFSGEVVTPGAVNFGNSQPQSWGNPNATALEVSHG
ncbi:transposase [Corallincola holothuriorum]|uniref:Transposase n=1 Tax=Corallincola holothuriorum TaxID=2282215 RepID=A0A368N554_9GAMM|nr:transposase [Corallincola holothuriorum]RCU45682.1 transposase [Corallincola holothuriorum]